ncbi:LCP family protein [Parafrankia sp. EUN1f]|uniref:LCP family protein n=1 Tax=Parafrankia sp. EUN1f TaxID=102897 RepID=UPI0001C462CA|nr:LCP family protein [Parafrankia sp. EUN1f]EFC82730.1 cell envelope-related transcriptional attenuator [Parafrankia sp. EUN1f]
MPFDLRGGRPRPTAARRLTVAVAALTSIVIMTGAVGGWGALTYFDARTHRAAIGDLGANRPAAREGAKNFLLVGTDDRAGLGGMRSDTTILAHLGEDGKVTLISFPRDTLVVMPAYTDSAGKVHPPSEEKFNSAIANGGPTLLIKLVEALTRVRIDHYISVDLAGFRTITEVIGGVDVCITERNVTDRFTNDDGKWVSSTNTNDPMSGFRGGPGHIQISGEQALAFVRQRHGLPGWDIGRTKRQQYFLSRILAKVREDGVLTSPARVSGLLSAVGDALTYGEGTSTTDVTQLASRLQGVSNGSLGLQTLLTHAPTKAEGAIDENKGELSKRLGAVQLYNQSDLDAVFGPFTGDHGDAAGGGDARISVLNGSGAAGVVAKVVRDLGARGISADNGGNAAYNNYKATWIRYGAGAETTARKLLSQIPVARLMADDDLDGGVQVIVGSTYKGLADLPAPTATQASGAQALAAGTGATGPATAATSATAGAATQPAGSTAPAPAPPTDCVY